MSKILELKEQISAMNERSNQLIDLAKAEVRELTDDENKEIEGIRTKIKAVKDEIMILEKEEQQKAEEARQKQPKISIDNKMKTQSLVKEIRQAMDENKKTILLNAEKRAVVVQGGEGVHDAVVETEIEGILEPLYANSVLAKLGARFYTGLPKGDVQIPLMGKSQVGWEGEVDEAEGTGASFTTVKLSPKRLSAYIDISKQLIAQDTIGVEAAIRRDLVNALNDKLEATLFGNAAGTTEKPAGLFYNVVETNVDDFAGLCQFEAAVESENVYGNMKYVMSPSAKATFRGMIKGTNATGMVYENGEMDGIETFVTTNVATKKFIYGDFSNLVVGSWGDVEITIDPYTQATKGCIRLIINAYFDFKPARTVAFNFGNVD